MLLPLILLAESLITLPQLAPFITAPGCQPTWPSVAWVLFLLAPLLLGLRLAFGHTSKPTRIAGVITAAACLTVPFLTTVSARLCLPPRVY